MFTNLLELIQSMPTEQACREHFAKQRWEGGKPICPYCEHNKCYVIEGGKRFKCGSKTCYKKFSVTVGTIFEASNIPLLKWYMAIYIITGHRKGISSYQLGRDLGITQKTAWFMLHRVRELLKMVNPEMLEGIVEIDETYMARKFGSEYKAVDPETGEVLDSLPKKGAKTKGAVIGMKERKGDVRVVATDSATAKEIGDAVRANVHPDTMLFTDESNKYTNQLNRYKRQHVNHSSGEWVRGIVHTNNIEAFWSVMKRGVYGIYHQISFKHLQAYCNEFSYRYNSREITDGNRFELTLTHIEGRLTYKRLVHGKDSQKEGNKVNQKKG